MGLCNKSFSKQHFKHFSKPLQQGTYIMGMGQDEQRDRRTVQIYS